jgi:PKD repeat protein
MQKTANEIKSSFELLASGHYQIHSFLYAQEFEQQAYENLIYPLMLVYPLGGSLSGTSYTRNYRVVIADRVLKSEGNELEVESDTQLIALDTLAYWMKLGTNERFSITSSNTITPFWEKWGDEVTGHFVDIGIEEFYDFNSCAIPLSSAIPSPTNPCKDARILINSVVYGNAPSDTNFNVVVKDQLGALVGSLIGGEWIVNTGGACADATYTIEDSLGNVLYTGTIPSGGSTTEVIGNSTLNVNKSDGTLISSRSILAEGTDSYNVGDSSAVLKDESGNVLSTTPIKATETEDIVAPNGDVSVNSVAFDDVLSGGTLNIEVRKSTGNDLIGSKQGQYWRIGDSTAVIKDSANNTLKSENIKATESENITINDSVAVIKNSAGTTLKSENILAQATENITISDSTAVIKDSIGTTLKTEPILAEATENITINDSSVNVNKSDGTLISAVSVKAENTSSYNVGDSNVTNSDSTYDVDVKATESLILPDSQINVNSVDSGDVVSVKTIDVNLEDSVGAPVVPTSVGLVGNTLTIEVPSGATPMDVDFSADKLTAAPLENITFTDLSDQSPTHWSWQFSDGTTSIVQNPVKSFTTLGFKNVTLMAGKVGAGSVIIKNSYIEITGDADALAFFARVNAAGGTLTSTEEGAITALVLQMKADNIWNSMKAIYPMVGASSAACAQNLKSSSFTLSFSGGFTFNSNGVTGNGTNAFANTGLIPSASLTNNSLNVSVYSRTNGALSSTEIGCSTSSFLPIIGLSAQNILNQILFDGYDFTGNRMSAANTDGRGLFHGNITSSTSQKIFKNGVLQATNTTTQTQSQPSVQPLYLFARNDSGVAANYSSRNLALATIGDGLTDTQASDLYTAVQAFNTSLSRQV